MNMKRTAAACCCFWLLKYRPANLFARLSESVIPEGNTSASLPPRLASEEDGRTEFLAESIATGPQQILR